MRSIGGAERAADSGAFDSALLVVYEEEPGWREGLLSRSGPRVGCGGAVAGRVVLVPLTCAGELDRLGCWTATKLLEVTGAAVRMGPRKPGSAAEMDALDAKPGGARGRAAFSRRDLEDTCEDGVLSWTSTGSLARGACEVRSSEPRLTGGGSDVR